MKKSNKKGFTLIELMIVLAIIAILAVVLVPKAGQMKASAKNAGIVTNVNTVRGFMESQPSGMVYSNLYNSLNTAFVTNTDPGSVLKNPLDSSATGIYSTNDFTSGPTNGSDYGKVVMDVYTANTVTGSLYVNGTSIKNTAPAPNVGIAMKGMVFVAICTDGYVIYGIDNTGAVVGASVVK